jgi:hypothetical protein
MTQELNPKVEGANPSAPMPKPLHRGISLITCRGRASGWGHAEGHGKALDATPVI